MDFSEAVLLWEQWQLRILVLASLFLQYFLFIAAAMRKRCIPGWFRFITWLAYLGSDAIAIYALATLFNRHKKEETIHSTGLEVLWAPVLLMHLGGQDGITAYNIEDNELWRRHVLTAASQITVAIYMFRKSWSGDNRLLQAAILIFIPGILKCIEKPWALKKASINSLVDSSNASKIGKEDSIDSLEKFVQAAVKYFQGNQRWDGQAQSKPYYRFVDIATPYSFRLQFIKFLLWPENDAHDLMKYGLSETFDRLYTKEQVHVGLINCIEECDPKRCCGHLLRSVIIYLIFAAIWIFNTSRIEGYSDIDVKVTYILLCCTAALEFIAINLKHAVDCIGFICGMPWPDQVAQYNLIGYLARNKKHSWVRKLATLLVCKDYLDQLWCMKPCESSRDITKLVQIYLIKGWTEHIKDMNTYREFNDNRGHWTLKTKGCHGKTMKRILQKPFDESVVLWHLATDFCFYHLHTSPSQVTARRCREISNYMVYLLFVNPEMMMPGARRGLFKDAYGEIEGKVKESPSRDEDELAHNIIKKIEGTAGPGSIHCAWALAQELLGICKEGVEREEKMWEVIQGVWVEMLCFSAGWCRGYLHAKSLGKGGEYLSYIWMLQSYMGMESLTERMQRMDLQEGRDGGDENV